MNHYHKGETVELSTTFEVMVQGVLTLEDPAVVTLKVRTSAYVTTTYTYGTGATIVRDSKGTYRASIVVNAVGEWDYQFEGTPPAAGLDQGVLAVDIGPFD